MGFETFDEGLRAGVEIYHALKKVLHDSHLSTAVGDEGGFAPNLKSNEEALQIIEKAVVKAGYKWGEQIFVALDPAMSELWNEAAAEKKTGYKFFKSTKEVVSSDYMVDLWAGVVRQIPDPLDRGRPGRERLGGMEEADGAPGRPRAARRGRPVRDEPEVPAEGAGSRFGERDPGEGEPDRHAERDVRGGEPGDAQQVQRDPVAPLRGDRGFDDRGHRGGDELRADQDGGAVPERPEREVQPADPDRGGSWGGGGVWGRDVVEEVAED